MLDCTIERLFEIAHVGYRGCEELEHALVFCRERDIHQLSEWYNTVAQKHSELKGITVMREGTTAEKGKEYKIRLQFFGDLRRQLYSNDDDRDLFGQIRKQLKDVEVQLEEGEVVISFLQQQLLNVACDDPGPLIGMALILPEFQRRLDERVRDFAAKQAEQAESELLAAQVRCRFEIVILVSNVNRLYTVCD
jgi:hypothetical protein